MPDKIPVEIFRDVETPEVDVAIGHLALDILASVADNFTILKDSRQIRISKPGAPAVRAAALRLDGSIQKITSAPYSIILTNRKLEMPDTPDDVIQTGYAQPFRDLRSGVAVISASSATHPGLTTVHEMGHLLGLQYKQESPHSKTSDHCSTEGCLMQEFHTSHSGELRRVVTKGITNWLERRGHIPVRYTEGPEMRSSISFCQPCIDQLSKRAFFLAMHHEGQQIPESWFENL